METNLIALKLFLDTLGHGDALEGVENNIADRLCIQKAVYLGQICGADLGYRYNWYVKGPYSPSLAQDYYELSEELKIGDEAYKSAELNQRIAQALERAKPLLSKPDDIDLDMPRWLELIASTDYLLRISKHNDEVAEGVIRKQKPHLAEYFARGLQHVKAHAPEIR